NFCTFHQFFTYATATTAIYTLSLHDALPISNTRRGKKSPPNYPSIAALCIDWYSVAWAEHGLSALRRQNGWEELQISVAQSAGVCDVPLGWTTRRGIHKCHAYSACALGRPGVVRGDISRARVGYFGGPKDRAHRFNRR